MNHDAFLFSRTFPIFLGALLAVSDPVLAQDSGLTVSGSVRLRYEAIDGQARAGFNKSDDLVNLRSNILAEYKTGNIRAGLEVYDSRVFGDDAGTPVTTGEVNALEPVQAYLSAEFPKVFGEDSKLGLTGGRMALNLGSRRLVASDDYRNTTSGYTGVRADLQASKDWKGSFIYTMPQIRLPDDNEGLRDAKVKLDRETSDLVLRGGQVSRAKAVGSAMAEVTYLNLRERDAPGRPTRDRSLDTFGARLITDPHGGGYDYEVEALFQTGHISTALSPTAARQSVSASFFHVDAGYSFDRPSRPRLAVEFDRASGDKAGGKFNRFDTLFGMRRAELAPAGLYNSVGRTNLIAGGLRIEATPSKRWDWFAAYRALWLAAAEDSFSTTSVRDATGESGKFAGHQLEGRVRYWVLPARLRFEFDGLVLRKGGFLRNAPNAPQGEWTSYGSVNLTASFQGVLR